MNIFGLYTILLVKFLILIDKSQTQFLSSSNLRLEVNPRRYLCCHVVLIRDAGAKDPKEVATYPPEQITNPQLDQIIQDNQLRNETETQLTWTVIDSRYHFVSIWKPFSSGGFMTNSKISNITFRAATYKSDANKFCTLFISWHYGVYSGISTPRASVHDLYIISQWSYWHTYTSGNRKLIIRVQNAMILSVTGYEPSIFANFNNHHEAMLMAPFLTFVIQILQVEKPRQHPLITDKFAIGRVWWACHFCQVEKTMYVKMEIFVGSLNLKISQSYGKINEYHRIIVNTKNQQEILLKPQLNAVIAHRGIGIWMSAHMYCEPLDINRDRFKFYSGDCFDPIVQSSLALADQLNMTASFGGLIGEHELSLYNHVSITVFLLESSMMLALNPAMNEVFLLNNVKQGFRYCEPKTKPAHISIFAIFLDPFDKYTWICMVAAITGILYYFYWKSKSILDSIFEVVKLVLQRASNQKYKFGILFLFGFFFLEFFFLSSATEKMIAPTKNYVMGSLSELFSKGHYLFELKADIADAGVYVSFLWELAKKRYHKELQLEGMSNFSEAPIGEYWRLVEGSTVFEIYADAKGNLDSCFKPKDLKAIQTSYLHGSHSYHENALSGPCKNQTCHTILKRYGHEYEMVLIHSKIRTTVKPVLSRIAHDSGIRDYWVHLEMRLNAKQLYRYDEHADVAVIRLDDSRFLSIVHTLLFLLGLAFVQCMLEKTHRFCKTRSLSFENILFSLKYFGRKFEKLKTFLKVVVHLFRLFFTMFSRDTLADVETIDGDVVKINVISRTNP